MDFYHHTTCPMLIISNLFNIVNTVSLDVIAGTINIYLFIYLFYLFSTRYNEESWGLALNPIRKRFDQDLAKLVGSESHLTALWYCHDPSVVWYFICLDCYHRYVC